MRTAIYKIKVSELDKQFIHSLEGDHGKGAELEIKVYPKGSNPRMTEFTFWKIISLLDWEKEEDEEIIEPVIMHLTTLPLRHLYEFQDILSEKLFLLDGKVFAENIGTSAYQEGKYFSVDHFLDVRACVIANGEKYFNWVLEHPEDMPKDTYFESLLYVVPKAWKIKTGKDFSYLPLFNYQTYSNESAWN